MRYCAQLTEIRRQARLARLLRWSSGMKSHTHISLSSLRTLTVGLLVAAMAILVMAPTAAAESVDTQDLWSEVERIEATLTLEESAAQQDVRRGLTNTARLRYTAVVRTVRKVIVLLDALYSRESDLDRQIAVLTRMGTARERMGRARDMLAVLEASKR